MWGDIAIAFLLAFIVAFMATPWSIKLANKFKGVRAAAITSEDDARFAKADDDVNVMTLGADCLETDEAIRIMRTWIATEFKGGRYQERTDMIKEIENENMK